MYVHSFYRAGPVIGSAISGIDQALWDLRGKLFGLPVYRLLGGPFDPRGVRGYYHAQRDATGTSSSSSARRARQARRDLLQERAFPATTSGSTRGPGSGRRSSTIRLLREGLGPDIDIGIDFHAKTSPAVASILCKELEPLNLLFVEEPCPPENVKAMARIARRSTIPIATGERLIASYSCRELIEMGVVDILQTDINHVGGITALWKVAAMADASGIVDGAACLRGPDRRPGDDPRRRGDAQLPRPGDLQRRRAGPQGEGLGGVARVPGDADGGRPVPAPRAARAWGST